MKKHMTMIAPLFAIAFAASACVGEADPSVDGDDSVESDTVAADQQALIATPMSVGGVMVAPMAPIAWNGMIGTWQLGIWAPTQLDFLAFNLATFSDLAITVGTMNAGVFTPLPLTAMPISPAYMSTISAGLAPSPLLATSTLLPALPASSLAVPASSLAITAPLPLVPTITPSALMLTGLPVLDAMTPLVVNVTFNAANATSIANLSIFAAQVQAQNAALTASTNAALTTSALNVGLMNPAIFSTTLPILTPLMAAPLTLPAITLP